MKTFDPRLAGCAAGLAAIIFSTLAPLARAAEVLRWEPPFSYASPATR